MFLILVMGKNNLESIQLGYWEGEAIWGGEIYCYTGTVQRGQVVYNASMLSLYFVSFIVIHYFNDIHNNVLTDYSQC